jgi:hypothetical protein
MTGLALQRFLATGLDVGRAGGRRGRNDHAGTGQKMKCTMPRSTKMERDAIDRVQRHRPSYQMR